MESQRPDKLDGKVTNGRLAILPLFPVRSDFSSLAEWSEAVDRHLNDLTERLARDPALRSAWWQMHGGAFTLYGRVNTTAKPLAPPVSASEQRRRARQRKLRRLIRAIVRQVLVKELPEAVALLTRNGR
jgi:hypothetical protein